MVGGKADYSVEQETNGKDGAEWLKHGLPHASSLIPLQGVRWADVLAQTDVGCCCAVVRQQLSYFAGSPSLSENGVILSQKISSGPTVRESSISRIAPQRLQRLSSKLVAMKEPARFRVATYNTHKCRGIDGRIRPSRVAEVLNEL